MSVTIEDEKGVSVVVLGSYTEMFEQWRRLTEVRRDESGKWYSMKGGKLRRLEMGKVDNSLVAFIQLETIRGIEGFSAKGREKVKKELEKRVNLL